MSLTITLTGTGGAQLVPVFGCDCAACRRARLQENYRRRPCSAVVKFNDAVTLLDAGIPHLMDDWPAGSFQQFLLTHYHMDHVQGLFPCAGAWGDDPGLRSAGRRGLTTCLNIRGFWISATRSNRL
jgi:phosphoribosyl 1,2-cyclic phosphodiesterase